MCNETYTKESKFYIENANSPQNYRFCEMNQVSLAHAVWPEALQDCQAVTMLYFTHP